MFRAKSFVVRKTRGAKVVKSGKEASSDYGSNNQEEAEKQRLPALTRDQFQIGLFFGQGTFSKICQIIKIDNSDPRKVLDEKNYPSQVETEDSTNNNDSSADNTTPKKKKDKCLLPGSGDYVIKILDDVVLTTEEAFEKGAVDFLIETKNLLICRGHEYIVQLRGVAKEATREAAMSKEMEFHKFFAVLDRLDDVLDNRLMQWLRERETKPQVARSRLLQKVTYASQLTNALSFLHKKRLIFRNLKPENIGFKPDPKLAAPPGGEEEENSAPFFQDKIQLFDFGLCEELPRVRGKKEDNNECGDLLETLFGETDNNEGNEGFYLMPDMAGSPGYMAGEVVLTGYCNLKCDVYSWAVVFYEMLALKPAFEGKDQKQLKADVWETGQRPSLKKLQTVPDEIEALLKQSWSKHPTKRPTSAECCRELERILKGMNKRANTTSSLETINETEM